MEIQGEKTVQVDGIDYFFVSQFAKLTDYAASSIRALIYKGNSIRQLKHINLSDKPMIPVTELFEFPFVAKGPPSEDGVFVHRYVLEDGNVVKYYTLYKGEPEEIK